MKSFSNSSKKQEWGGTFLKLFYKASITLIPKTRAVKKRKLDANIPDEHRCKIFEQNSIVLLKEHTL